MYVRISRKIYILNNYSFLLNKKKHDKMYSCIQLKMKLILLLEIVMHKNFKIQKTYVSVS